MLGFPSLGAKSPLCLAGITRVLLCCSEAYFAMQLNENAPFWGFSRSVLISSVVMGSGQLFSQ